ncbi:TIM-barrel domain-containing protein [Mangrovibacterium marinum]|uniref:Alpha-glucosidase n=1 Tax=Mangrovibacterium marinum TaxID=1639118 RepID=A0A2T5C446_9BACT|nr:TIM-barrel domain-containing protein [Mangrovibacterium marinum]PTN09587.1 alpha-glucosidase [Mangrovibacterium marinum]
MRTNRIKEFSFAISIILSLILVVSCGETKRQAQIGDGIAIYYPGNFIPERVLPSMALLEEPVEKGSVSSGMKIKPEFYQENGKNCARIAVDEGTDLYGTGEVAGDLNRTGKEVTLWNTDNYTYAKDEGKRLYQSHPWILGVRKDGTSFGILVDNTWKQEIKLTNPIEITSEGPASRIIVIEKETPQAVLEALGQLTGTMEMPPLWALGYQQCRYSYFPDSRVKEVASEFRKRNIPCDVIWMDIHYMQDFKIFTFDSIRFPNPAELNDYLHGIDFKSVWMIDPGAKKEEGYFVYDQGTDGNYWVQDSTGNAFVGSVWPGPCSFPDFTMPETRAWWGGLYKDFMATGIDGVWNDMNEPAVFDGPDNTMPENNYHRGGGELPADVHARYHDVYGMLMVKASREGILKTNPDKRPFVLSRSNYLGGQRYAATWTGDNASTWEQFKMATPMVLNLGLSGQPFSGPDIGGYKGDPDTSLLANWMAVGAFYPFSRNHTEVNGANQEPYAYGDEVEEISRIALERRYRLLPYLYTLFHEASETGLPVMRPVFFADVTDLSLRNEDEAFLWGGDLLIVPKWAENPALPKGTWTSISLVGEDTQNDPVQPDLKLRGGAIIPLGKVIQSTEDYSTDSLTLLVCLDEAKKAEGELYSDAGNGFEYRNGQYAIDQFKAGVSGENKLVVSCSKVDGDLVEEGCYYRVGLVTESGIQYSDWDNDGEIEMPLVP